MSISRNDPCTCGSGLKYKKCCLGSESAQAVRSRKVTKIGASTLALVTLVVAIQFGIHLGAAVGLAGMGLLGGYLLMQDA